MRRPWIVLPNWIIEMGEAAVRRSGSCRSASRPAIAATDLVDVLSRKRGRGRDGRS